MAKALSDAKKSIKKTEIIAIDAGFDMHAGDLVSFGLATDDFYSIGRQIAALEKPTFFIGEGGYRGQIMGEDIDAFLQGFES
jgi:acetoin utilization deacetylase AcuC-like enzyme